jgi:hypothetical protein
MYCLVYYFYLLFLVAFMYLCDAMNGVGSRFLKTKALKTLSSWRTSRKASALDHIFGPNNHNKYQFMHACVLT